MKKKKRGSYPGIQIGTSYLLVIFVILCLVTFATLSLSSAKRDQSYSQQLASRETAYCEANAKAAQIMAQIDDAFAKEDPVFAIRQIEGVTAEEDGENLDIFFDVAGHGQSESGSRDPGRSGKGNAEGCKMERVSI